MELQNNYQAITDRNAEVLAISTDDLSEAANAVETLGIPFPVLSDQSQEVPKAYHVFNLYGDGLATGSVFIVDTEGALRWSRIYSGIHDFVSTGAITSGLDSI